MSNDNTPDDSTHPLNMDEDARKAAMAALDDEDGAAEPLQEGDQIDEPGDAAAKADDTPADDEGKKPEGDDDAKNEEGKAGEGEGDEDGKDGKGDDEAPKGEGEDGAAADTPDDEKVDKKAFNGLLNELRSTREEVKALKAQQTTVPELPEPKDFKAEKTALKDKWEAGDLDTDEYHDQRDTLTLEEAEHRAAVRFHTMQQQAQQANVNAAWQEKVSAWEQTNADFLANPIRKKAVSDLMTELDSDPNNKLSDEELLEKVQVTAFEAFNWSPAAADDTPPANARQVASARAAASASATPPAITGGVGNAATAGKLDLEDVVSNPEKYGKQARAAVDSALGEEA